MTKIGLLADAHGNGEAFDLAVSTLAAHGVQRLVFLGDAVGYLPGRAVLAGIAAAPLPIDCIKGNHEAMLLAGTASPESDRIYRLAETAPQLDDNDRAAIDGWPARREESAPCGRLIMVHGSPADPLDGYLYPDTELQDLSNGTPTTVFSGATHRPFVRTAGATTYVNVGSCGLPRDCGHLGAACLFDDQTGEASVIRFDISAATQAALARCGPVAPEVEAVFERTGDCFGELL